MMVTRKLRRRNYDAIPAADKRRRTSPFYILTINKIISNIIIMREKAERFFSLTILICLHSALIFELEENEIEEDLKIVCKVC